MGREEQRVEVLDGYHRMENLAKVSGTAGQLDAVNRIPNDAARQQAGEPIGSGRVESLVKQIAARVKLSGAQWSTENVPQVLRLRCAYLNGAFAA